MNRAEMTKLMHTVFEECHKLREAGQNEYAHNEDNVHANFDDDARELEITREKSLLIFANKHWRGIRAWARGHRSQRENVRGRINDLIVYLALLRGMVEEVDLADTGRKGVPCIQGEHGSCTTTGCTCECHNKAGRLCERCKAGGPVHNCTAPTTCPCPCHCRQ